MALNMEWAADVVDVDKLLLQDHGESLLLSFPLRMHAQIVCFPLLQLTLTCMHTVWVKVETLEQRQTDKCSFSPSSLIFIYFYFVPKFLHIWLLIPRHNPCALSPWHKPLSTALTGCLCLSLTPYGLRCFVWANDASARSAAMGPANRHSGLIFLW